MQITHLAKATSDCIAPGALSMLCLSVSDQNASGWQAPVICSADEEHILQAKFGPYPAMEHVPQSRTCKCLGAPLKQRSSAGCQCPKLRIICEEWACPGLLSIIGTIAVQPRRSTCIMILVEHKLMYDLIQEHRATCELMMCLISHAGSHRRPMGLSLQAQAPPSMVQPTLRRCCRTAL